MMVKGKIAVITGAASGIGRATALRFAREGAAGIVVADIDREKAEAVAAEIGGLALQCDVSKEEDIRRLVHEAEGHYGRIDVYFSNAGIIVRGGLETPGEAWEKSWRIHVMAHVWAAQAVVDKMVAQGGGYFLVTASAAGLLNIVESASYGVTKHGAVAFAEWLAITYGRAGLRVSCLCPQSVETAMHVKGGSSAVNGVLTADRVADDIVNAMAQETFLVLPHPEVLEYMRRKTGDYDRWIGGMQKLASTHRPARSAKPAE